MQTFVLAYQGLSGLRAGRADVCQRVRAARRGLFVPACLPLHRADERHLLDRRRGSRRSGGDPRRLLRAGDASALRGARRQCPARQAGAVPGRPAPDGTAGRPCGGHLAQRVGDGERRDARRAADHARLHARRYGARARDVYAARHRRRTARADASLHKLVPCGRHHGLLRRGAVVGALLGDG